jgi:hypothetical protein
MSYQYLQGNETELRGELLTTGAEVRSNHACRRIAWLLAHQLNRVAADESGEDTLYRDPRDGRLWELTYPESPSHTGGPPTLTLAMPASASAKYGVGTS